MYGMGGIKPVPELYYFYLTRFSAGNKYGKNKKQDRICEELRFLCHWLGEMIDLIAVPVTSGDYLSYPEPF